MNGAVVVTADHGNAEEKISVTSGEKRTKHTMNPVPIFIVSNDTKQPKILQEDEIRRRYHHVSGVITDIAPTIFALMGINKPAEMMGIDLSPKINDAT